MTSKSFSSKGLLWDSMRRNMWALVLAGVGFFLSLLLPTLMTLQNALEQRALNLKTLPQAAVQLDWKTAMDSAADVLGGDNPFVKMVFLALAVVCGVAMFAYLHNRQKVDFYHSLPISRTRLFANNFLTGVVCPFVMYFIMQAITVACACAMGCGEAVRWNEIGGAVLCHLIVFLLVYALTVLTTVFCGNTIITLLLLAWVFFSPLLVRTLMVGLCQKFYDTYVTADSAWNTAIRLSPVFQYFTVGGTQYNSFTMFGTGERGSAAGLLIGYLIAAVAVTALALFLYRIRRSERAGTALAFLPARVPVKVFMCMVIGTAFALVFELIAGSLWFWVGLVVGTVLFHWIVEIIYAFDFRAIFGKPLHLLAILVVLAAVMLGMKFDVTGFDRWVPDRADMTAVQLDSHYDSSDKMLTDPANLDAVHRLMELGVQQKDSGYNDGQNYQGVRIYCQTGNSVKARYYVLPENNEVDGLRHQIYQSEEYKRTQWPLFTFEEKMEASQDVMVELTVDPSLDKSAMVDNAEQAWQIIHTLREESLCRTDTAKPVLEVGLYVDDGEGGYGYCGSAIVSDQDTETLAQIKELTGLVPQALDPAQVTEVQISYLRFIDEESSEWETVSVTDRADIEALLQNAIATVFIVRGADGFQLDDQEKGTVNLHAFLSNESEEARDLSYLAGELPTAIIEKYRPDGTGEGVAGGAVTTAEAAA